MNVFIASIRVTLASLFIIVLTACGSGGDSTPSAPPPIVPPPVPPTVAASPTCTGSGAFSVVADVSVAVGKAAGAVLAGCTGSVRNVQWTQVAGPAVTLMSAKSQAISFEPPSAGTYTFSVTFLDAAGGAQTGSVSVNAVAPTVPVAVLVRVDHAARKTGNGSLRAWPPLAASESYTWTQTAGPQVTLDTSDPNHVLFIAPEVTRDTALTFRVTRRTAGGATDTDDVFVLVENYAQAPPDPSGSLPFVFSDLHVSRTYPYRAAGPFAGALVRCTYEANLQYTGGSTNLCPLSLLPFLHQTTSGALPTVDQIMDRVVVSHDWMGETFEQLLRTQASQDILRLFNGVTAIVIGAQVRPSFYYALTGAIYLDADNFWLTATQRDVINEAPDFRSDFDRDLMYSGVWRYTQNNQNIFLPVPATSRLSRDISYLLAEAGWLLYHELAHASDFMPVSARGSLNSSLSAWANIEPRFQARQLPSDVMAASFPLQSAQLRGLAQVKFFGATADATQRAYTPNDVANFFASDRATDEYSYSTTREDIAMTFEEFMMVRNHGWRRDVAITDKIGATTTSNNLIVRFGQRGRIGEAAIKPRARYAVSELAPWVNLTEVDSLPAPIPMRAGDSWASNLVVPAPPGGMAGLLAVRTPVEFASDRALLERALSGSHGHGWTPNERWLKRASR
ncbi:MAG TPA: hypothetical protein VM937_05550 [Burkholderiaceae bacterium]|nr:hypothetical protein [Burkholderiaceae bacterium]